MTTRPNDGGLNKNQGRSPDQERKGQEHMGAGQTESKGGGLEEGQQEDRGGRDNQIDVDGSRNREGSTRFQGREDGGKSPSTCSGQTGASSNQGAKNS